DNCAGVGVTWENLAEPANNTTWPTGCGGRITKKRGGGGLAEFVQKAEGEDYIGYVALSDANAKGATWVEVQNNGTGASPTFGAPQSGSTTNTSNCEPNSAVYGNPVNFAGAEVPLGSAGGSNEVWTKVLGSDPKISNH